MKEKLKSCLFFICSPPGMGLFVMLFFIIAFIDSFTSNQLSGYDVYYLGGMFIAGILTGKFIE